MGFGCTSRGRWQASERMLRGKQRQLIAITKDCTNTRAAAPIAMYAPTPTYFTSMLCMSKDNECIPRSASLDGRCLTPVIVEPRAWREVTHTFTGTASRHVPIV